MIMIMKSDRRTFLKTTGLVAGAALAGVDSAINSTPAAQIGTGPSASARDEILGWIRGKAIPVVTVEAGSGFADLEQLRHIIGRARIVSLGEATHGTREFFQLKHRLLEFCVSELGFTLFGIEANYPESLRVNDYVLHGTGDPAEALAGMRFWTWDTEEVLSLIEWMRIWNTTHERKVKFYGFDMQSPTEAALGLIDYLKRVVPELAVASEAPLWPLSDDFSADRFRLLASETQNSALNSIARILEAFTRQRAAWVEATNERDWGLARLHAIVLDQGARLGLARSYAAAALRDSAMAQNVRSLLQIEGPDARAVLWAHNGHVAKVTPYYTNDKTPVANMGRHLHEMFGKQHLVVGFAFNQGSFQATESGRGLVDHTVPPAPEGSLDSVLAAAAIPTFLLDLATAPVEGRVADWLSSRPLSRSVGALYSAKNAEAYLKSVDPRSAYDVLAFVAMTTAARAKTSGRRPPQPTPKPASTATNLELAGSGSVPEGWTSSGSWRPHGHTIAVSDERSPAGGRTVRIARSSAPWRWGEGWLQQVFSAEAWRGKRLRFSSALRAEAEGPGTGAQLYIEVEPKPPEGATWSMAPSSVAMVGRPVQSPRWVRYAVEIDVPDEAQSIVLGLAFTGNGEGLFGDIRLESGLIAPDMSP